MSTSIRRDDIGLQASTFGLGTIAWGTKLCGDDLDLLYDTFRATGGNFFDSAHVYSFWLPNGIGASERALGEIVRRRRDQKRVILATKGGHPNMPNGYPRPDHYLAPETIARDIAESLDRLGVEVIDLYFLHRDDPRVPVGEVIDLLNEHISLGQLRQIGASNWTNQRIAAANEYAATHNKVGFIANQPKFSLAVPVPSNDPTVPPFEQADIDWHAQSGLTVCAYSPTANGFFASNGEKNAKGWQTPASLSRLRQAIRLAGKLNVTPNQIALAWLLHQRFQVIPILGTVNVEHLKDALGASDVRLTREQMDSMVHWG